MSQLQQAICKAHGSIQRTRTTLLNELASLNSLWRSARSEYRVVPKSCRKDFLASTGAAHYRRIAEVRLATLRGVEFIRDLEKYSGRAASHLTAERLEQFVSRARSTVGSCCSFPHAHSSTLNGFVFSMKEWPAELLSLIQPWDEASFDALQGGLSLRDLTPSRRLLRIPSPVSRLASEEMLKQVAIWQSLPTVPGEAKPPFDKWLLDRVLPYDWMSKPV